MQLKLKKNWIETTQCRVKYDDSRLRITSIREKFGLKLKNKFEVLHELHEKEESKAETLGLIEERKQKKVAVNNRTRAEKAKAQVEYTEVHRAVKKSIRKDKKDYIDGLAAEAEQAAYNSNMKQLYGTAKKTVWEVQQARTTHQGQGDLPINSGKPTREEIGKAITLMKNGKAAGLDNIPAEALKADLKSSVEILYLGGRRDID
ncbi:Hypothetical predicted protein [Pelobates cultripes]|uniref:Uncharacterized protein n=1 Tax=Pelobates cultripes TaxID=61616 RepID=A0AAD1SAF7_PELCU|nr:Hypothetical predicted protein [Pelobates cultripes]